MDNNLFVSIVIPARNASRYLKKCLCSIGQLDYPRNCLEVIVADNGSTDKTASIAREWGAYVVDASGLKIGGVRNCGAYYAKGTIIAFTDSDIIVSKLWIASAVKYLENNTIGAVGGGCLPPKNGTWVEKAWVTRTVSAQKNVNYLAGSNFILKRDLFEKLGGFNEDLVAAEDDDLSRRIREKDLKLLQVSSCDVIHLGYPRTLYDVSRRQIWHGSSIGMQSLINIDPMALLTYNYLLALILLIPISALSVNNYTYIKYYIFIISIGPLIVATKKAIKGSEYYSRMSHLIMLYLIYHCYFIGNSIGIIKKYINTK